MDSQDLGLRVASILFGVMAILQMLRLALRPEVLVNGHLIPLWPSVIAVIVLAALCAWLWTLGRHVRR
jgi:hypothetical protein